MATVSKKKKNTVSKKAFLKWDYRDDFIVDFDSGSGITLLKCKICRKYTA